MLSSNKPPWGLIRGGLICKNGFLDGGLFEGCLFECGGLVEDLLYNSKHKQQEVKQSQDILQSRN